MRCLLIFLSLPAPCYFSLSFLPAHGLSQHSQAAAHDGVGSWCVTSPSQTWGTLAYASPPRQLSAPYMLVCVCVCVCGCFMIMRWWLGASAPGVFEQTLNHFFFIFRWSWVPVMNTLMFKWSNIDWNGHGRVRTRSIADIVQWCMTLLKITNEI